MKNFNKLFDYKLPYQYIAQEPAKPRDFSKLMVYSTKNDRVIIDRFFNLPKYLDENYFLVFNDTKVLPSRVSMFKETKGKVKILFLLNEKINEINRGKIKIIRGLVDKKLINNQKIFFDLKKQNDYLKVINQEKNIFTFEVNTNNFLQLLEKYGETPLPPYIKNTPLKKDEQKKKYQTIFAQKLGSVAGPTASFHFTHRVFKKLKEKRIKYFFITLHIGLGTFAPVTQENLKKKKLHPEYWEIDLKTYHQIKKMKQNKKLIAVGTTTTRMLESLIRSKKKIKNNKFYGITELFILPPFEFKMVDALITNFHLPKSSLMMLIEAFLQFKKSRRNLKELYEIAIKNNFRFYSFGDAMLIL
jgi:S-adenosylmethionine:tRNA ribosyltransferase-isomerase